jgi:hypothetical protein
MPPSEKKLIAVLSVREWFLILNCLEIAAKLPLTTPEDRLQIQTLANHVEDSLRQFSRVSPG